MRTAPLLGAAALALMASSAPARQAQQGEQDIPDTSAAVDGDNSGEIVVTATKRETTLQDTPVAVSVTSGETIRRAEIRDLIDLQTVVPSLRVVQLSTSAGTNFFIRGFGNGGTNVGIEPSVGVFIDGVYRSRAGAQIADLPNVQRIEVLRGPQSTLFGKNASAGVVSIVTAPPSFTFGGIVEASYGNYDAKVLKGVVTGPITQNVAFSLGGNINKRDGYVRDPGRGTRMNDRDRWGVRGQLLFDTHDDFSVRLIGDYDRIDEICCAVANAINGPTGAVITAIGGKVDFADPYSYEVYTNYSPRARITTYGGSAHVEARPLDNLSLTSITAYRIFGNEADADSDFTSADILSRNRNDTDIKTFTQEVRIASDFDGPANFLLGGYYFNEKIVTTDDLRYGPGFRAYADTTIRSLTRNTLNVSALETLLAPFGGAPGRFFGSGQGIANRFDYRNEAASVFGQVDFRPVDGLTLTAGFNYTNDRKRARSDVSSDDVFARVDLVQVGFAQALGARGVNVASPAAVAAFAAANPALYNGIVAGAQNPAVNTLLGLRGFQLAPPFLNFPNAVERGRTHDDNLSYTLRASYEPTRELTFYASYSTGFKASSFNLSRDSRPSARDFVPGPAFTNPAASPVRTAGLALTNLTAGSRFANPEKARAIELGLKAQFTGFSFNGAVFDQRIDDFQGNIFTGTGYVLANAPRQSVRGVELEARLSPVRALTFTAALTYLDAKFDSFPNAGAIGPGLTVVPADVSGQRVAGIPEFTVNTGVDFTQPLGGGVAMLAHVDFSHASSTQIVQGVLPLSREMNLLNASLGVQLGNGLDLSVFGRNLTNDRFLGNIFPSVAQPGSISGYPSQPRTYGVTGRFRF